MPLDSKRDTYDSDEDEEYVPPAEKDSESEPSDEEDAQKDAGGSPSEKVTNEEERKRAREALWSNFQASVTESSTPPQHYAPQTRMVKIERRYLFAGNKVVEVVDVSEDSPDAKKWPLWQDPNATAPELPPSLPGNSTKESLQPISTTPATQLPSSSTTNTTIIATKPPPKRPGPRKPKTTLASLPGTSKAKKLTTLDKSAMDWKSHIQSETEAGSSVKDELEANRRGGGYLEKVEFLKRVDERKEEALDAMKSNKRRRL